MFESDHVDDVEPRAGLAAIDSVVRQERGRGLVDVVGENVTRDRQRDRGLRQHARQLTAADDAHTRARMAHDRRFSRTAPG